MSACKIRPADRWFSLCIRERADWHCERCGSKCPDDKRMGLHASHFHGRGKWATRFDPDNARALCYGCHQYCGANPDIHRAEMLAILGDGLYQILQERSQDSRLGRLAKRSEADISKHYRAEHTAMRAWRSAGQVGRMEFEGWA